MESVDHGTTENVQGNNGSNGTETELERRIRQQTERLEKAEAEGRNVRTDDTADATESAKEASSILAEDGEQSEVRAKILKPVHGGYALAVIAFFKDPETDEEVQLPMNHPDIVSAALNNANMRIPVDEKGVELLLQPVAQVKVPGAKVKQRIASLKQQKRF